MNDYLEIFYRVGYFVAMGFVIFEIAKYAKKKERRGEELGDSFIPAAIIMILVLSPFVLGDT